MYLKAYKYRKAGVTAVYRNVNLNNYSGLNTRFLNTKFKTILLISAEYRELILLFGG